MGHLQLFCLAYLSRSTKYTIKNSFWSASCETQSKFNCLSFVFNFICLRLTFALALALAFVKPNIVAYKQKYSYVQHLNATAVRGTH